VRITTGLAVVQELFETIRPVLWIPLRSQE